jgi:hypothetical protein
MRPTFHLLCLLLVSLAGWMNQQQQNVIDYLQEEYCVLREQLGSRQVLQMIAKYSDGSQW